MLPTKESEMTLKEIKSVKKNGISEGPVKISRTSRKSTRPNFEPKSNQKFDFENITDITQEISLHLSENGIIKA